jgi:predicted DNA-binding transcriptional regulator AlpA
MSKKSEHPHLVSVKEVAQLSGLSVPTLIRYEREGKIPKARRLSARCVRWSREVILEWLKGECEPTPISSNGEV